MVGLLTNLHAQEENKIGVLAAYGSEIESLGLGANAEFPVLENLAIAPSIIYYFPRDEYGVKWRWLEINANANYYFVRNQDLGVYALGGLNYSSIKVSYDESAGFGSNSSASDGEVGLNFGAGANFNLGGKITPFTELKYVLIEGGQLVAAAGVKFRL